MTTFRVGSKVPLNVYDGDRPVCQCHNEEDAARIVAALNDRDAEIERLKESNIDLIAREAQTSEEFESYRHNAAHAAKLDCDDVRLQTARECAEIAVSHIDHGEFEHGGRHDCEYAIALEIRAKFGVQP